MGVKCVAKCFHRTAPWTTIDFVIREVELVSKFLYCTRLLNSFFGQVWIEKLVVDDIVSQLLQVTKCMRLIIPVDVCVRLGMSDDEKLRVVADSLSIIWVAKLVPEGSVDSFDCG